MRLEEASALLEEALALQRQMGDMAGIGRTLAAIGHVAIAQHDYERAVALHEESLALAQEVGDKQGISYVLSVGMHAALGERDYQRVVELCAEGLELCAGQFSGTTHPLGPAVGSR